MYKNILITMVHNALANNEVSDVNNIVDLFIDEEESKQYNNNNDLLELVAKRVVRYFEDKDLIYINSLPIYVINEVLEYAKKKHLTLDTIEKLAYYYIINNLSDWLNIDLLEVLN